MEVALATALRRGELLALRWQDVELLDGRLHVRQAYVRGEFQAPKSRSSRRTLELGPRAVAVLGDAYEESRYRAEECLVFCHPALGTPLGTPPGWHASTCAQRWRGPRSPNRFAPGMTFATRRSRTRPRPVTRRRTCS